MESTRFFNHFFRTICEGRTGTRNSSRERSEITKWPNGVTGEGRCHINPVTPFPFGELRSRLLFLVRILFRDRRRYRIADDQRPQLHYIGKYGRKVFDFDRDATGTHCGTPLYYRPMKFPMSPSVYPFYCAGGTQGKRTSVSHCRVFSIGLGIPPPIGVNTIPTFYCVTLSVAIDSRCDIDCG
jgi:hypothetical protein